MDFAKKQLQKYGWKEGQGLGKNEDGISTALKPKLKFDNAGIGHNQSKEFTDNWWEKIYQNTLDNIEVNNEVSSNVRMSSKNTESLSTTNGFLKQFQKPNIALEYGSFVKTAKLTQDGIVNYNIPRIFETQPEPKIRSLTDDELFAACGGRTAHKAARYGMKLSGKLSRLEKQEKILLKKLQNVSLCDEKTDIERKIKKITKHRDKHKNNYMDDACSVARIEDDSYSSSSSTSKKHKKKKKRKSVSFNETVTEYHTQDMDSSVHSSDSNEASVVLTIIEQSHIKDEKGTTNLNADSNVFDEGIEQDLDAGNSEDCNHDSFEQAQCSKREKLSKAERKLIKKKNRATMRFLQELKDSLNKNLPGDTLDGCKKCIKRKQHEDYSGITLSPKRYCESTGNVWDRKRIKKKNKDKARKRKKRVEKRINSIARSLDKVCKISDNKQ